MCRLVGRGGQGHNRRCPCGSGPGDDEADTPDCQSGERHCPHPETGRDSDGGSSAWSANQVVATAECVTEGPGTCLEDEGSGADEVDGLVRRAAPHLNEGERQQLQTAMIARQQMFEAGKGDLG